MGHRSRKCLTNKVATASRSHVTVNEKLHYAIQNMRIKARSSKWGTYNSSDLLIYVTLALDLCYTVERYKRLMTTASIQRHCCSAITSRSKAWGSNYLLAELLGKMAYRWLYPTIRRLWVRIPPRTKLWCLRCEKIHKLDNAKNSISNLLTFVKIYVLLNVRRWTKPELFLSFFCFVLFY